MNYLKIACALVLVVVSSTVYSQINVQWQSGYDNNSSIDQCVGIVVDPGGNSYVTGTSHNGTSFDIVTIKYDIDGNELWVTPYNGSQNAIDEAKAIAIDNNGFIYVTGHTYTGPTDQDIVTIKYNPTSGVIMWSEEFVGTANYDISGDIAIDGNNNIYVTGTRDHTGNFRVTTIKYDSNGNEIWNDTYNGPGDGIHFGKKIAIDANDDVFVLCEIESAADGQDFTVLKYAAGSAGVISFEQSYDADENNDIPEDIFVDANFLYLTGGSYTSDLSHKQDYFTVKADKANGNLVWQVLYNGPGSDTDIAASVISDGNGDVYITGNSIGDTTAQDFTTVAYNSDGTLKWIDIYASLNTGYDVGNELLLGTGGDIYASGTSFAEGNSNDYLTIKFSPTGTRLWETRFNGPANGVDNAIGFYVDPTENIYITGKSKTASTNFDYRTIKYCQLTTLAANDTSICIGETVTLTSSSDQGSNFTWNVISGDPVLSCTSCQNTVVTPSETTVYTVSSESGSGCVDFDTVVVTINPLPGPTIINYTPLNFCIGDSVSLHTSGASAYLWNVPSNNTDSFIVVHNTGNYSVTVEDVMGCQNTTDVDVIAHDLPTIDGGTDHVICLGDSTQLDASGGDTYLWIFDATIDDHADPMTWVYPTETTTYEVVGTDLNGCKDTGDVVISINQLPLTFSLVLVDDTMVTSPNAFGNEWFFNDAAQPGITGNEVDFCDDAFGAGEYWVTYTDVNNCSINSDTLTMDISDTLACWRDTTDTMIGVNEFYYEDLEVYLFPNPAVNSFQMTFIGSDIPQSYEIYGMDGKAVITESKVLATQIIDISHLMKGQYFVIFQFENGKIARKKLIKN